MTKSAKVYPFDPSLVNSAKADGFTRVPNQIAETLCQTELSGRQYRVLIAIIRSLLGFNKTSDWLAPSQIADRIKYSGDITNIRADLRELQKRKIIFREGKNITLNMHCEQWIVSQNRSKSIRKQIENDPHKTDRNQSADRSKSIRGEIETDPKTDRKQHPQKKDTYSKDTNTKNSTHAHEAHASDPPSPKDKNKSRGKKPTADDFITALVERDVEEKIAREYVEVRKSKRATMSTGAIDLLAAEAAKAGVSLHEALTECVIRNWQGFKADWLRDRASNNAGAQPPLALRQRRDFSTVDYSDDGGFFGHD